MVHSMVWLDTMDQRMIHSMIWFDTMDLGWFIVWFGLIQWT